ncbi:hypothetical protein ASF73_16330 [Xanthomonas sp. Leaf131]|nr:hypothetical protein ASF73_16330 [Xanthomonas sp. Leaf131]
MTTYDEHTINEGVQDVHVPRFFENLQRGVAISDIKKLWMSEPAAQVTDSASQVHLQPFLQRHSSECQEIGAKRC